MASAGGAPTTAGRSRSGAAATLAVLGVAAVLVVAIAMMGCDAAEPSGSGALMRQGAVTVLPAPDVSGGLPLNAVLAARRSVRAFAPTPLTAVEIGQLLWAAQGITTEDGRRTAPSAGALYPLEVYVVDQDRAARYLPADHTLVDVTGAAGRDALAAAALGQASVAGAPAVFVITAVPSRTAARYGQRAMRYVSLEAGHAAQNLLLAAVALGLAGVPVGAFDDDAVAVAMGLPDGEIPLYLVPVGHPD